MESIGRAFHQHRHLERLAAGDVSTCEHRATIWTRRHGAAAFQHWKHTSGCKCARAAHRPNCIRACAISRAFHHLAHSATPTAPGAAAFASSRARCRIAKWLPGISNAPNVQSMPGSHALHFLRRPPTKPALTHAATQLQQRHLTLLSATQHFPVSRQDPAPLSCCLASRTLQVAQWPRNRCTTVFARCVC